MTDAWQRASPWGHTDFAQFRKGTEMNAIMTSYALHADDSRHAG